MSGRSKALLVAGGATVLVLLLSLAAGTVFCMMSLKVPRRVSPAPTSLPGIKDISVTASDGARLVAWFVPAPESAGRCVMVLHGIADSRRGSAGFARMFLDAGYSVLLPDSRAHGRSGGEFVTYGLLEKSDVVDWARWLLQSGCSHIYGLGESLGAAVLIQASATEPVFRAIVAECAYSDLRSIAEYRLWRLSGTPRTLGEPLSRWVVASGMTFARIRYGLDFDQVSPLTSIRRSPTPILLIHGLNDSDTPPRHSEALAAVSSTAELWLVPGAGHTGASDEAGVEFRNRVLGWFSRH